VCTDTSSCTLYRGYNYTHPPVKTSTLSGIKLCHSENVLFCQDLDPTVPRAPGEFRASHFSPQSQVRHNTHSVYDAVHTVPRVTPPNLLYNPNTLKHGSRHDEKRTCTELTSMSLRSISTLLVLESCPRTWRVAERPSVKMRLIPLPTMPTFRDIGKSGPRINILEVNIIIYHET
jgi:hypothetical protein